MTEPRKYLTPAEKSVVMERHAGRCGECGEAFASGEAVEWDHVYPLWLGGSNDLSNWQPIHAECHRVKTTREHKARAKGNRILGITKRGPKKKITSRPFWRPKMPKLKMGEKRGA